MDERKLARFKKYLETSEKEITQLRKELDVFKKANYGSPVISTKYMQANRSLTQAEVQLEQGWQAYELFKKGQIDPEDKDMNELLIFWEDIIK